MIAIADSGSTKTDWVILDENHFEKFRTTTIGFNPYHVKSEVIAAEIAKNQSLMDIADELCAIYFYGAGCSAPFLNDIIKNGLRPNFPKTELNISHDLLAACYAVYREKPAMVCILGTGSNACYFDGESIYEATPSLAYILGDEGSGCHLGKKLIHAYFTKKLPTHLSDKFKAQYNDLSVAELNVNVYQKPFANAYLASFSTFIHENKSDPYIQNLIFTSLEEFFENQVLPNPKARFSEVNFIGSVAHYYEDIIRSVASTFHLEVGHIVRKPIDALVKYHIKHIL